jgi:hypothetical protein
VHANVVAFDEFEYGNFPDETAACKDPVELRPIEVKRFRFDPLVAYSWSDTNQPKFRPAPVRISARRVRALRRRAAGMQSASASLKESDIAQHGPCRHLDSACPVGEAAACRQCRISLTVEGEELSVAKSGTIS